MLGILAVALSYFAGRELLGRQGGAVVSVVVAASPLTIHLGQFARGYTAMMSAAFASLWILLVLLRTRQLRWVIPYGITALLLVSAHPFGLFALASELAIMVVLGVVPLVRERAGRKTYAGIAAAGALGVVAILLLHHVYAPLQNKYGVGHGRPVVQVDAASFWSRLGDHASGSSVWFAAAALAAAVVGGFVVMVLRNRRAAIVAGIWIGLPMFVLAIYTASSPDFAPERHLSFLMPGYAVAIAALIVEVGQRLQPRWRPLAVVLLAGLLAAGVVYDVNDLGNFNDGLRNASLQLADEFGPNDVLLTTAGKVDQADDPRLFGAYAGLTAPLDSPLSNWHQIDRPVGCELVHQIQQQPLPERMWMLVRPADAEEFANAMQQLVPGLVATVHDPYVLLVVPVHHQSPEGVLQGGEHLWHKAVEAAPDVHDFRHLAQLYRHALTLSRHQLCA